MSRPLPALVSERLTDGRAGVTSVCTAHPMVIEAALALGLRTGRRVLIEATCNQVNQEGGYTGMTPADFRRFVEAIAARVGFDPSRIILGGDHLGPNPWKHLAAADAMDRARAMVEAYARSGFAKLHLDTSMGCAGEPAGLVDELTAERAASLAKVAETAVIDGPAPVYVIGTEVPVPGGAQHALATLTVTRPEAALRTVAVHRQAFKKDGLEAAFGRAIGVVVQPGVEFAGAEVVPYEPGKAKDLTAALSDLPGFVFEAHSTDYQPSACLEALVSDGFSILKVGPWLTFALREALYGLDCIADALNPTPREDGLPAAMEALMLKEPQNWRKYYDGTADQLRFQRHFSFSDRIRYYWPHPEAQSAVERLFNRLGDERIPEPLISQYLSALYLEVAEGSLTARPKNLVVGAIQQVLMRYEKACSRR
jgi:D-tagatose-bisphosphate aldolase class II non-catalytic subunit